MAVAGQEIVNPAMGRLVFRQTAGETGGALLEFDFYLRSGGQIARPHLHPVQEERFDVLSGEVHGRVAGADRTAIAGDTIVNPPGTPHVWWNGRQEEEAHLRVFFRPALDAESFFEAVFAIARAGKANEHGVPRNPLQLAVLLNAYRDEFRPAGPPPLLLRAACAFGAAAGRSLGYRASATA
jgi:quercetin dioxygenase-like cupin family protein